MEKLWTKNYPKDIPDTIDEIEYNSLVDLFDKATRKYSTNIAFSNLKSSLTFNQTKKHAEKFASYLQTKCNSKKNTKVAIMLPNLMTYPVTLFGSFLSGATVVNVNPLFKERELENVLIDSEADIIIVLDKFFGELEPIISKTNLKHIIVCKITDLLNPIMKVIVNMVLLYKGEKKKINHQNIIYFNEILKTTYQLNDIKLNKNDIAFLQYTGGTTGKSKAAILTHGNLLSNIEQLNLWIKNYIIDGKEVILTALPLYHIFSLTVNCLTFFKFGAENVLITNPRDLRSFLKTLKSTKFTVMTAVNTLFNLLLTSSDFKKINFDNFKFSVGGGMAVLKDTAEKWKTITGTNISQGYGLTETSPVVTINIINHEYNGTIGLPLPSTHVSIRDEKENEVVFGEKGELCVKGPQVMKGYWKNEEETKNAFTKDGFFKTGDVAMMNSKGFVKIVDRKKDMIISSGFNVYPNEIEDYLTTHQDIIEVGAIGLPDKNRGESIKVFVVSKNSNLTQSEVIAFCKKGLTIYKIPKTVVFVNELPKSNVGKILRRKLRDL
ncbi:MAG: long-chain-fatty-acid--CoA ligase [Gammaproteobacteria bacterium]|nr:long-chain-fatty-acid--CoA ligase [Gammaproteobacteria bacterium]